MAKKSNKKFSQVTILVLLVLAVTFSVYAVGQMRSMYSDARTPSSFDRSGFQRGDRGIATRGGERGGRQGTGVDSEMVVATCEDIVGRAQEKLASYDSLKESKLARYAEAKERALSMLQTMDGMGYDTSQARENIAEIDRLVPVLVSEIDALVAKWNQKTVDCSDPDSYQAIQDELNADLTTVRDRIQEITDLARAAIESVRGQVSFQGR